MNLPDGISSCQKHTEGVTGMAALQLERSPGWVPVPALPAPGAPQEMHFKMMHFKMMHFTTTSSEGTFLLTALPERNCVTPGRFWGSKPLSISSFPTACQTHVRPSLESSRSPSQRPGLSLLFHSGGLLHAPGTSPSQNTRVSV